MGKMKQRESGMRGEKSTQYKSGSGSGEDRLLGVCQMVSGIVIFQVKIDI